MQRLPPSVRIIERDWLSANQILFHDDGESATLVDTGYVKHRAFTARLVGHLLGARTLVRILNTHLHSDHCGGNAELARRFPCEILVPRATFAAADAWDEEQLTFKATGQFCDRFHPTGMLSPGQTLVLGGLPWQVHAAPGHDPDSILLFQPDEGILISADALWQDGFGVIFPEISGASGFDEEARILEVIETLAPRFVIPGHGPAFANVAEALNRARQRLAWLREDPTRNARYALKVMVKFLMLELERAPPSRVHARLDNTVVIANAASLAGMAPAEAIDWAIAGLASSGQFAWSDGVLVCPGAHG